MPGEAAHQDHEVFMNEHQRTCVLSYLPLEVVVGRHYGHCSVTQMIRRLRHERGRTRQHVVTYRWQDRMLAAPVRGEGVRWRICKRKQWRSCEREFERKLRRVQQ